MLRTHTCGELRKSDCGKTVALCGWVNRARNLGGLMFVDLRDRYGLTQLVFNKAVKLHREDVIKAIGKVCGRKKGFENKDLNTGDIEISVSDHEILSASEDLPIEADDDNTTDESRLKYRYLDLRRPVVRDTIIARHKIAQSVREYFNNNGFIDIETPLLGKSTPEGARDYLVPSRVNPGKFYALPQSPQLYKQILMIAGFDRYYQIVKCLRDEDLRADRQPEFTQIDVEMSFIEEDDIIRIAEGMLKKVWKDVLGIELKIPFNRIKYDEAMARFGTDRPDMRYGLELTDLTHDLKGSGFKVFESTIESKGAIKGLVVSHQFSRKQIDKFTDFVKIYKAKGLVALMHEDNGLQGGIVKFLSEKAVKALEKHTKKGDTLFIVADTYKTANDALGMLRGHLAEQLNMIEKSKFEFVWVTDFPMFVYSEDEQKIVACHHPFTSPKDEDLGKLEKDPLSVKAKAYDIVLNGVEIGGGSIRIHKTDVQSRVFKALNLDDKTAQAQFGFLLEALKYGTPPHGGIAFGFDRFVSLINGLDSIRDVIAFPKTKNAECLMTGAPSEVNKKQLEELKIRQ